MRPWRYSVVIRIQVKLYDHGKYLRRLEIALTPHSRDFTKTHVIDEGIGVLNITAKFPETMRVFEELCGTVNMLSNCQAIAYASHGEDVLGVLGIFLDHLA